MGLLYDEVVSCVLYFAYNTNYILFSMIRLFLFFVHVLGYSLGHETYLVLLAFAEQDAMQQQQNDFMDTGKLI